ncbi:hypothetical protein B0H14DRAFT_2587593 [Mycena olivaceomarginata]|nr:hypothetical protein B0H14DRAFT_2587593 [Mycena olivaceomarginata]
MGGIWSEEAIYGTQRVEALEGFTWPSKTTTSVWKGHLARLAHDDKAEIRGAEAQGPRELDVLGLAEIAGGDRGDVGVNACKLGGFSRESSLVSTNSLSFTHQRDESEADPGLSPDPPDPSPTQSSRPATNYQRMESTLTTPANILEDGLRLADFGGSIGSALAHDFADEVGETGGGYATSGHREVGEKHLRIGSPLQVVQCITMELQKIPLYRLCKTRRLRVRFTS